VLSASPWRRAEHRTPSRCAWSCSCRRSSIRMMSSRVLRPTRDWRGLGTRPMRYSQYPCTFDVRPRTWPARACSPPPCRWAACRPWPWGSSSARPGPVKSRLAPQRGAALALRAAAEAPKFTRPGRRPQLLRLGPGSVHTSVWAPCPTWAARARRSCSWRTARRAACRVDGSSLLVAGLVGAPRAASSAQSAERRPCPWLEVHHVRPLAVPGIEGSSSSPSVGARRGAASPASFAPGTDQLHHVGDGVVLLRCLTAAGVGVRPPPAFPAEWGSDPARGEGLSERPRLPRTDSPRSPLLPLRVSIGMVASRPTRVRELEVR